MFKISKSISAGYAAILPRIRRPHPVIRFAVIFVLSLTALSMLNESSSFRSHFVTPYLHVITAICRWSLGWTSIEIGGTGVLLTSAKCNIKIIGMCSGLGVMAIFAAAVLGFPSSWRAKLVGLGAGCTFVFVLNIVRIDVLFLIGHYRPELFSMVHHYHSQAVIILASVALWLVWASKSSSYGSKPSQVLSD